LNAELASILGEWQFWILELQFLLVVVTTFIEAPRVLPGRGAVLAAVVLAMLGWGLASTLPPRTNRIFYDEQIYQGIGRSLAESARAELCNEGDVEYGRLRCTSASYNKEPNAYPYLLSVAYRIGGVSDLIAPRLNNLVAGLAVLVTFALAAVLFRDVRAAAASGVMLALMPMQIAWANTAAVEPAAALFSAAAVLAAVHYARTRTASALAWTAAVTVFAISFRPESILVVPIVLLAITLLAPAEFRTRRFWIGAGAAAVLAVLPLAHLFAVWNLSWESPQARMSWNYLASNFPTNFWFYIVDERFPALFTFMALAACFARGAVRERLLLVVYFLVFWGVFLFFYAGSYDWGTDVRYSLLSYVPIAVLAGAGCARLIAAVQRRWLSQRSESFVLAAAFAAIAFYFLSFTPLIRSTGEEAWAARADVRYAKEFSGRLRPNSIVLTHNPSMFHVWGISAAQLSLASTDPLHVTQDLFPRYAGGVYVHWNFWCHVTDVTQRRFCAEALKAFPHELVDSRQERDHTYALYRLKTPPATQ
jgi:hypothetical protein